MHDQPGAEQLNAIETSQLSTIAGGVIAPAYRLSYPSGPRVGWYPPIHHPAPPQTCYPPAPPTHPLGPFWPGFFGGGYGFPRGRGFCA